MKWQISFHKRSKKENILLLLIVLSHISIITSLFHIMSLGESATFTPDGYCE